MASLICGRRNGYAGVLEWHASCTTRIMSRLSGAVGALLLAAGALLVAACAPPAAEKVVLVYPPPPEQPRYYYDRTITGSGDVMAVGSADRFKQFATGQGLRGKAFSKPFGIVAANERIYVSDTVARRVAVLDFQQNRYFEFGDSGLGRLAKPMGMAVDASGRVYVCDGTSKRVLIYDAEGNFLTAVGDDTMLDRPSDVAVNAEGTKIYVVDTGGVRSQNHRIRVFDPEGAHLFDIGKRGREPGKFNLPLSAAVSPSGQLHVLDSGNFRVQVFSAEGEFLFSFGKPGRRPGFFSHPKSIAVDRDGKIFVADTFFGNIQIFDEQGRILMFIGDRSDKGGPGEFILPAGVTVDADGRIYLVDQFFRKIDVFRPAGLPESGGDAPSPPAEG